MHAPAPLCLLLCALLTAWAAAVPAETQAETPPPKPIKLDTDIAVLAGLETGAPEAEPDDAEDPPPEPGALDEAGGIGVPPETETAPEPEQESLEAAEPAATPPEPPAYLRELQAAFDDADPTGDPDDTEVAREDTGVAGLALEALVWLLLVCGIIILLAWLLKRVGRRTPLLAGQQYGQLLGRLYLTPKVALHFVQCGGRVLVIGVTATTVALITELDEEDGEHSDRARAPARPGQSPRAARRDGGGFASRLHDNIAKLDAAAKEPAADEDDEIAALRGDIERLRNHLRESGRDPRDK